MSPGVERVAAYLSSVCPNFGGADEIRTRDPLLAKQVLYQLSYDPENWSADCMKELLDLDIYFVRSTGTRKPKFPSTIEAPTGVDCLVSLERR